MPLKDLLFGFEGRIRRRDWWLWTIVLAFAYAFVSDATAIALGLSDFALIRGGRAAVIGDALPALAHGVTIALVFLWPQLALAAKRAHDRNRTAGLVVALSAASVASSFLPADPFADGDLSGANGVPVAIMAGVSLLLMIASLYLLIVLGFQDGTRGPNRFGRSPKGYGGDPADTAAEVFS